MVNYYRDEYQYLVLNYDYISNYIAIYNNIDINQSILYGYKDITIEFIHSTRKSNRFVFLNFTRLI